MLIAIWNYRVFVINSIRNEFKGRFARSTIGGLWMIIHPLAQVAIFSMILTNVISTKIPGIDNRHGYALYMMSGTLAWSLFSDIITRCTTLFIDQASLIKKVNFPRITLPIIAIGAALLNNLFLLASILMVFFITGNHPTLNIFWILPLVIINASIALGIGVVLGTLNVYIRDIGQITPVAMQILFWFTPIVYPDNILSGALRDLLFLNPIYEIVRAYQQIVFLNASPSFELVLKSTLLAISTITSALLIFKRANRDLVDAL